jgi:hypothetical protein
MSLSQPLFKDKQNGNPQTSTSANATEAGTKTIPASDTTETANHTAESALIMKVANALNEANGGGMNIILSLKLAEAAIKACQSATA